jgi:hypothetical protein
MMKLVQFNDGLVQLVSLYVQFYSIQVKHAHYEKPTYKDITREMDALEPKKDCPVLNFS